MRVLTYTHTYKHEGTHIRTHTLPLYLSLFFTSTARSLPIPLITYIQGIWEGHWMPFVCRRGGGGGRDNAGGGEGGGEGGYC
jgi:hypothetical protein